MDVVRPLARRLCLAAALFSAAATLPTPVLAADPPPANETPLQLQKRRLDALRAAADAASPTNVPDRDALVKAMIVVMAVADPALLPDRTAGLPALDELRSLCANGAEAGAHLVRMAQATGETGDMVARMSVAMDRVAIMVTACAARQLDIRGRAILARPGSRPDAAELTAMREAAASLPASIANIVLGATLLDLNPNSRTRTAMDAAPVLLEAVAAMPPASKAATLEAVEKMLGPPERDGHIDTAARDVMLQLLRRDACGAGCEVLGASEATPG